MFSSHSAFVERSWSGEIRRLVQLAWPVVVAQLGFVLMGAVDVMMVGQLGAAELAGVSVGNMWSFGTLVIVLGCASGLDPLFAQSFGAGQPAAAGRALARGATFLLVLCVPVVGLHLAAEPALTWLGQPPDAIPIGARYTEIMALGVLPFAAFALLRRFLQGNGLMMPATWAMVFGNAVNLVVTWVLVFGHFGAPQLGAMGAAWASVASRFVMLIPMVWLGLPMLREARPRLADALDARGVLSLAPLCVPVGLQVGGEVWGFTLTTVVMGWLGTVEVGAHTIALGLASVAFMVPLGISQAASTRVGNLVGAGSDWRRAAWAAIGLGGGVMLFSGLVFLSMPGLLARMYTPDVAVLDVATRLIPVAAAFGLFDGIQAVSFGVLRGAGDVRMPAVANLVGYYALGLPAGYFLAFHAGMGALGPWVGLVIALGVVACLLLARVRWVMARGARQMDGGH